MTNIEKLMNMIPDNNTCALITSEVNRRYFTGFKSSDGVLICFKEKAYLIIDFRYYEKAYKTVKSCEVIEQKNKTVQLSKLFKRHCTSDVMIEAETLTVSRLNNFKQSFPKINVNSSMDLSRSIDSLRIIKSESEEEKIIQAQNIADQTYVYVLDNVKEGMTERDIAIMTENKMKLSGAEDISFDTIVLTGRNTSLPHGEPGYDKIIKNSFVLMDFGAVIDGWHSDMTRTFYMGKPSDEEITAYNIVLDAQKKALDSIVPGMLCSKLDSAARDYIAKKGFESAFGHSLGHGVGMEIHENPAVSKNSSHTLEPGMVVTIEPGIYIPDRFGIRIEDMVIITHNSYKNLTHSPKELITL